MAKIKVKKNKVKTILVVEDDKFLREMYKVKLELDNFKVMNAGDGESGLKCAIEKGVDLVLLDIVLPKMNGFEVLAKIKKVKKEMPVILLTNLAQKEDVERGLSLGADDYIIKAHFVPSEVVKKVKHLLG